MSRKEINVCVSQFFNLMAHIIAKVILIILVIYLFIYLFNNNEKTIFKMKEEKYFSSKPHKPREGENYNYA